MKEKLEALLREGAEKIQNAKTESELQEIKGALLGKQGSVTELLKEIPKLDVSLRPEMGKAVNNVKTLLSEQIEGRREELKLKASAPCRNKRPFAKSLQSAYYHPAKYPNRSRNMPKGPSNFQHPVFHYHFPIWRWRLWKHTAALQAGFGIILLPAEGL